MHEYSYTHSGQKRASDLDAVSGSCPALVLGTEQGPLQQCARLATAVSLQALALTFDHPTSASSTAEMTGVC